MCWQLLFRLRESRHLEYEGWENKIQYAGIRMVVDMSGNGADLDHGCQRRRPGRAGRHGVYCGTVMI